MLMIIDIFAEPHRCSRHFRAHLHFLQYRILRPIASGISRTRLTRYIPRKRSSRPPFIRTAALTISSPAISFLIERLERDELLISSQKRRAYHFERLASRNRARDDIGSAEIKLLIRQRAGLASFSIHRAPKAVKALAI